MLPLHCREGLPHLIPAPNRLLVVMGRNGLDYVRAINLCIKTGSFWMDLTPRVVHQLVSLPNAMTDAVRLAHRTVNLTHDFPNSG